jgi:hypothetical protein
MTNPPVTPIQQQRKNLEARTLSTIPFRLVLPFLAVADFRGLTWITEKLRREKDSLARIRRHPTAEQMSDALQKPPYLRKRSGDHR